MRNFYFLFFLIAFLTTSSCKKTEKDIVMKIIQTLKNKSINRDKINWLEAEQDVLNSLLISKDSAIVKALSMNNNQHTYYLKGEKIIQGHYKKNQNSDSCYLSGQIDNSKLPDVGYLKIERFHTNPIAKDNDLSSQEYISKIIQSIKKQDRKNLKGWVIDLRYNSGGDMWPMLIALTPFLSSKVIGSFQQGDKTQTWLLKNNEILLDENSQNERLHFKPVKYRTLNKDAKFAILINHRTASGGEAVAIAMKSLKNVKFFGQETRGFATSNEIIHITNNEALILTVGYMASHNGKIFPDGLSPDIYACKLPELNTELQNWFKNN